MELRKHEEISFNSDDNKKDIYDDILKDDSFQKQIRELSVETGTDIESLMTDAREYMKEMYASHEKIYENIFVKTFKILIDMGFDKNVDINFEEIKKISELMKVGSVAFVSSHKSYLDLIILFILFSKYNIELPYMFGGINLQFPVFADISKKSGIIFLRRNIDNKLYKYVLQRFIQWLLKKRSHFVWAIEGTRSRTGKQYPPKLGLLKYLQKENITFIPLSIGYELLPDLDEIVLENQGKNKKSETLEWLISYFKKICSEQRGKISFRFGSPINFSSPINTLQNTLSSPINTLPNTLPSLISPKNTLPNTLPSPISSKNTLPNTLPSPINTLQKNYTENLVSLGDFLSKEISNITPITTVSLISLVLLNRSSCSLNFLLCQIKELINQININNIVNSNFSISKNVERGIKLLEQENIILHKNNTYTINCNKYAHAVYYANLVSQNFYARAFTELAFLETMLLIENKEEKFWEYIFVLKDFFRYEYIYDIDIADFKNKILSARKNISTFYIAPFIAGNCLESYKIAAKSLNKENEPILQNCSFLAQELYWNGKIKHIETITVPLLQNAIKLLKNTNTDANTNIDTDTDANTNVDNIYRHINKLIIATNSLYSSNFHYKCDKFIEVNNSILTKDITQKGAHIGAFFDLDRTLIKGFSALSFAKKKLIAGKFKAHEIINLFIGGIQYIYDNENFEEILRSNIKTIKGIKEKEFIEIGKEAYEKEILIYEEAYELVKYHISLEHTVCIISAASIYQIKPIADKLNINIIECTEFKTNNGIFTGELEKCCWGKGKLTAGNDLAKKYNLDMTKSYFYTDSHEDILLLEAVGNPRPINADLELLNIANEKGWKTKNFEDFREMEIQNIMRTALSYTMAIPTTLSSIFQKDREGQEGNYDAMNSIADIATSIGGIIINTKNEENIWKTRPCVFILNHQSHVDMIIAIKLIKKDAISIAKKEISDYPIFGDILKKAGTVFIDKNNGKQAIELMKPTVDALKNGTSIVIFPEGTRSFEKNLGNFKKGAFHIAMQAGVPLVPIVIHNSYEIMPRGCYTIIPGIIKITVLPAILTNNWKLKDLDDNIQHVRNLFLEELQKET